jgi:hypothetical protein
MSTIHYQFADGHTEEIEVTDEVAAVYEQLLKYEKKVERKETRRHISLNALAENGIELSAQDTDILEIFDKQEQESKELQKEKFRRNNLAELNAELLTLLTLRQAEAYFRFRYLHIRKTEIAKSMGVTEGAVRKLILKAESNLQSYRLEHEKELLLLKAIFGFSL